MRPARPAALLLALLLGAAHAADSYPLDGAERTGIHRLEAYARAQQSLLARGTLTPGSLWPLEVVQLALVDHPGFELPPPDPERSRALREMLGPHASRYGVAVLDLTDPEAPVHAEYNGALRQSPGSVGKILVALAWFQALADLYPDDVEARADLLRDTVVEADAFIRTDHHVVPFWKPGDELVRMRPIAIGDRGNLWTWLDWMLSSSSNAAAAVLQRELVLLRHFGRDYPVPPEAAADFLDATPRAELARIFTDAMIGPLARNGLDADRLRQGSLFTRTGKERIPGARGSVATAGELLRFLVRLEQGRLVDPWSSLEIKRLLYLTDRRIRYASHPALDRSAVFFKSGSLYSCKPEAGFVCEKYHGNVRNYMNSVAIVESREEGRPLHYLVAVLSNVLRENSAVAHQTLALRIHRFVQSLHPVPMGPPAPERRVPAVAVPSAEAHGTPGETGPPAPAQDAPASGSVGTAEDAGPGAPEDAAAPGDD